jgi:enhancing lycopene biosynthesis protein 2
MPPGGFCLPRLTGSGIIDSYLEEIMSMKVGVVLSGCGVFDGSEIHEAVSILIALDRRGAQIICTAPAEAQTDVTNHVTGKPERETRNMMVESARIARGKIRDIAQLTADELDALVFPGGYGAAKNLSDFAKKGAECKVHGEVERLINEMHQAQKPMGFACISPVIAARVLTRRGIEPHLTIGSDRETAKAIDAMGAQHHPTGPTDIFVDHENLLVTTPCYMNDVGPWAVYEGAEKMVEQVLRMAGDTASMIRGQMANFPARV